MLKMRSADPAHTTDESVEAVRRRAQYRLVGTVVLVVAGVIGFPLVFDTQPRPVHDDLPIIIPDKTQVSALQVSPVAGKEPPVETASAALAPIKTDAQEAPVAPEQAKREASSSEPLKVEPTKTEAKKAEPSKAELKPVPVAPAPKAAEPAVSASAKASSSSTAAQTKSDAESARALAILQGKPVAQAPVSGVRVVVQVGSYSDQASVTRVRRQLESAGLKTYTQVISTSSGRLTRVRLGPYDSTAQAEKIAARVKALGLDSSIVKL
jgi:DedD protein